MGNRIDERLQRIAQGARTSVAHNSRSERHGDLRPASAPSVAQDCRVDRFPCAGGTGAGWHAPADLPNSSHQASKDRIVGSSSLVAVVMAYSTLGGTSAKTVRVMRPSASSSRSCTVSMCCVTPGMARFNSPKRYFPWYSSQRISSFHFPDISVSALRRESYCSGSIVWLSILTSYTQSYLSPFALPDILQKLK